ncbi:MAG: metallophosphoesterase [Muribaculaceae bacterium]|nr:metallophosphoesterase [Muribaculaceae bacterium]
MAFIAFFLILLGGQVYVSIRTWQLLPLPTAAKIAVISLFALALMCLVARFLFKPEALPWWLNVAIYKIGTSWLILLLYAAMCFIILDLAQLCRILPHSFTHHSLIGTVVITSIIAIILVAGNICYHHKAVERLTVTTTKPLPRDLKVVMMSDLHLGYHIGKDELHQWVDMINDEKPDLILIAGDIVDISLYPIIKQNMTEEFKRFDAPVIACLGNHEYYAGEDNAQQFYTNAGITLLRDSAIVTHGITIIGRDDAANRHRKPLNHILLPDHDQRFSILLDHEPYHLEKAQQAGIDFQFSGHTHHGQVWPISWITDAMYEKSYGSYQRGNTQYYISSGIGIWGGKFRIGTRSEYVVLTIQGSN